MIAFYQSITMKSSLKTAPMAQLPTIAELREKNPPCYQNSKRCADAPNGCRRKLLAQVCEVCDTPSADCVKKPASEPAFPVLTKAVRTVSESELSSSSKNSNEPTSSASSASLSVMTTMSIFVLATMFF